MAFTVKKPAATKFQPKTTTTTKPEEKAEAKFSLKVTQSVAKGEERPPIESVCLLWDAKTKKGDTFYKGTHKESKSKFFMIHDKKENKFRLSCVGPDSPKGKDAFEVVCFLEEKSSDKIGKYYMGKDEQGQCWFVYPYTKKL